MVCEVLYMAVLLHTLLSSSPLAPDGLYIRIHFEQQSLFCAFKFVNQPTNQPTNLPTINSSFKFHFNLSITRSVTHNPNLLKTVLWTLIEGRIK